MHAATVVFQPRPTPPAVDSCTGRWPLAAVVALFELPFAVDEGRLQRAGLIGALANLAPYPESVPINHLVQVEGAPLAGTARLDPLEFVRTIAVARITMPTARVRLSAGRQADVDADRSLLAKLGMTTS
jgi:biotin synthase-like enzyme